VIIWSLPVPVRTSVLDETFRHWPRRRSGAGAGPAGRSPAPVAACGLRARGAKRRPLGGPGATVRAARRRALISYRKFSHGLHLGRVHCLQSLAASFD